MINTSPPIVLDRFNVGYSGLTGKPFAEWDPMLGAYVPKVVVYYEGKNHIPSCKWDNVNIQVPSTHEVIFEVNFEKNKDLLSVNTNPMGAIHTLLSLIIIVKESYFPPGNNISIYKNDDDDDGGEPVMI